MKLRAPAKLNLYLRVLGKRLDGYHEIETLFERIDLADELTFEPASELLLSCNDPTLSCGDDNLVLKAAKLLQQASGTSHGARMHLEKHIPVAAGLGGGSSDAATTLRALNDLWKLGLGVAELTRLAAQLGSDVPFFLVAEAVAIGRGRGEQCEPIAQAPKLFHVLVTPQAQLSTQAIYESAPFDLTAPKPSITMVRHALCNGPDMAGLAAGLWNDLEPEAIRRCPVIARIQSHLRTFGCLNARVSGSGPSVFGLCREAPHAQEVAVRLQQLKEAQSWHVRCIHTDLMK